MVNKKPPTKPGRYLVTLKAEAGSRHVGVADRVEYPKGNFTWNIVAAGFGEIIAWSKMPKPFEAQP